MGISRFRGLGFVGSVLHAVRKSSVALCFLSHAKGPGKFTITLVHIEGYKMVRMGT